MKCTECGRAFDVVRGIPILLPRTDDSTEQRYLANYEAMASDDLAKAFEGNRPARHQKLTEFIGPVRNKRVLDIGSSDAVYLRQMDAAVKVAVDIATDYLFSIPADSGVVGICGDAERLPIKAGYFDVVIISDVLEHVLHPELVARNLSRIARTDTSVFVHIPWQEDLTQYRDVPYEFTHLRAFDALTFATLFSDFYERRSRGTYPRVMPVAYALYGKVPRPLYNALVFIQRTRLGASMNRRVERWYSELPKREWRLLRIYPPIFRQFELRLLSGTRRHRFVQWLKGKRRRTSR